MLKSFPKKPCHFCGLRSHWPYQCYKNPKNKKFMKKSGKYTKQWLTTRQKWIKDNPPNHQGYWICYLQISPECQKFLTIDTLTLDHMHSRSRHSDERFKQSNLQPCCYPCNELKGSKDVEMVELTAGAE